MILLLDPYLIKDILSFTTEGENFILYETCKYFKEFINYFKILKTSPYIYEVLTGFNHIKWAESHNSFYYPEDSLRFAVARNDINIVNYVYNKTTIHNFHYERFCYFEAIQNKNLKMIKWLKKHDFELDQEVFSFAVKEGNFKIIKWLYKKECPFDSFTIDCAAYKGKLSMLKFLIKNGCDWTSSAYNYACINGSLQCIKYLHQQAQNDLSKPWWDMSLTSTASEYGRLYILKFLKENGCPFGIQATYNAMKNNHINTLVWLLENNCPVDESVYNNLSNIGLKYEKESLNIVV